jgi:hypothetical protein
MALQPCRECHVRISTEANACPRCGCPNPTSAPETPSSPQAASISELSPAEIAADRGENTSGMGKLALIPTGERRWNWGAFTFGWIWAIPHHLPLLALLGVLPTVGLLVRLYLGLAGNELAWRNRYFEGGVDEFLRVERKWRKAALIYWSIILFCMLVLGVIALWPQG